MHVYPCVFLCAHVSLLRSVLMYRQSRVCLNSYVCVRVPVYRASVYICGLMKLCVRVRVAVSV